MDKDNKPTVVVAKQAALQVEVASPGPVLSPGSGRTLSPADIYSKNKVTIEDEQVGFTESMQYDDFNYWKADLNLANMDCPE